MYTESQQQSESVPNNFDFAGIGNLFEDNVQTDISNGVDGVNVDADFIQGKTPFTGQTFSNLESVFVFYKNYGKINGFDIRKSSQKCDKFGNVKKKYFVCSRSGSFEPSSADSGDSTVLSSESTNQVRRTVSIKCDCPAKIIVKSDGSNGFIVSQFFEKHNHAFARQDGMQFLKCNRALSEVHKRFIIDAAKSNIGPTRAHTIFRNMTGSYENVGATSVDFRNFSRNIKEYIGRHDADMIIKKFKDMSLSSDNSFKFEYQTDENNHLTRLIWADGIGRRNYDVFGDVVSFDATYRTNKYNMVFVPFVGIDNHWKSITFASALFDKENVENFKWGCQAFNRIFGRLPKCVITDQCPAMKIAIEEAFPGVKHRLCMWHIMKKFPAKLGTLFCAESPFMVKLKNFVWSDHVSKEDFEDGWNDVINEFGLSDHSWLKEMYAIRSSWIPAYFKDDPMTGLLRTTSRSESSNFYFSHFVQRGDTLSEFYICYDSAIERQRHINSKLNHDDNSIFPTVTKKEIEKDAACIYTRTMFYKVQEEIIASGGEIEIISMTRINDCKKFIIKDPMFKGKEFEIEINLQTLSVDCSCKLFTRVGYLCSHCFFCLGICGIQQIPRPYVMNRWLKKAEERFSALKIGEVSDAIGTEGEKRLKMKDCWFEFQACISDASSDIQLIDYLYEALKSVRVKTKEAKKKGKMQLNDETIVEMIGSKVDEISVLPPNQSNNKGCRKRIVGAAEKSHCGKKRLKRECKTCKEMAYHDSRNCPTKNTKD